MSKIGRKPIMFASVVVEIKDNIVFLKGAIAELSHKLPECLKAEVKGRQLFLSMKKDKRHNRELWGLHRALLANKVKGAEIGFEQLVTIKGLGYKAQMSDGKMIFTLGFSHKIYYTIPDDVSVEIDKSGQKLLFKSSSKFLLGNVCDKVRSFRPPEPYKGTGIMRADEIVIRKAGKTKAV